MPTQRVAWEVGGGGKKKGISPNRFKGLDLIDRVPELWTEFEQAPGDGEGQGGLECCSPWGDRESDVTE